MSAVEQVLYADENGTDLLIDDKHNVNLDTWPDMLSCVTHQTRDGKNMEVFWHPTYHTFMVYVAR